MWMSGITHKESYGMWKIYTDPVLKEIISKHNSTEMLNNK